MATPDPRMIELMSYYRDAELHGATLLLRLIKMMDDPDAQVKLAAHLADETRHAWLWTKRINEMGGEPMKIADGYQKRGRGSSGPRPRRPTISASQTSTGRNGTRRSIWATATGMCGQVRHASATPIAAVTKIGEKR